MGQKEKKSHLFIYIRKIQAFIARGSINYLADC